MLGRFAPGSFTSRAPRGALLLAAALASSATAIGCKDPVKVSVAAARPMALELRDATVTDVAEVVNGAPGGARLLAKLWAGEGDPARDSEATKQALLDARETVPELRSAKSTFFALTDAKGVVLRSTHDVDQMTGKSMLPAFPDLSQVLAGKGLTTRGSMPEAAGVRRADGEWLRAEPVKVGDTVKGAYVAGWSWSLYAYRLEFAARTAARRELDPEGVKKLALVYVYVVVGKDVYGGPVAPEVNARAIAERDPLAHLDPDGVYTGEIAFPGSRAGLVVVRTPALGDGVGVAIVRTEAGL